MQALLIDLFLEQAERQPAKSAVVHNDQAVSYGDLRRRVQTLAADLLGRFHIANEELVGIHGGRTIGSLTSMLAVLQAGGAYVPLPADHPAQRKRDIIVSAGLKVVLDDGSDELPMVQGCQVMRIEDTRLESAKSAINFPKLKEEQLAYVMYTSGSTGAPKGVMIEQRNMLAMLAGFEKVAPASVDLAGSALVSIGFDVSVWEIFSVLCSGGTLHLIDHPEKVNELAAYFQAQSINSAYLPPMILGDFTRAIRDQNLKLDLQRLLVGVEPIPQKTLQDLRDAVPGLRIVNGYGPTETAICATFHVFENALEPERRTPIGKAVDGYQVHLVDENLREVETGQEGEILICGAGVGRGYFHDARLSAEKFIPNPFGVAGGRCYRSGDYARQLPDGSLEFSGRKDQQVKINGYRVEPAEIEAALASHAQIERAVVQVERERDRNKILAYYTAADGKPLEKTRLRKYLNERLPLHMRPQVIEHLTEFPRTENGKIDRNRLRQHGENDNSRIVEGETEMENLILQIFREVFEREDFGLEANFFELGGNSLQAARILARVQDRFGQEISFSKFYECESIVEVGECLAAGKKYEKIGAVARIPGCDPSGNIPLSYSQERMWFLAQSEPDNPSLHSSFALRINGSLDEEILRQSLGELIKRHAILRTVFRMENGQPCQVILRETPLPLRLVDLSTENDPQRELQNRLTDANLETFDISLTPPFRMILYRLNPREAVLGVIIHHIIVDGWSAELFRRDLAAIYGNLSSGLPAAPEKVVSYADYACWQKSEAFERRIQPQLAYWQEKLGGEAAISQFPNDQPRPLAQSSNAATTWLKVSGALYKRLGNFSREAGITQYAVLLSAFSLALSVYTRQSVIQIGSFFANRPLPDLENILGPFVNGAVLKLDLAGNPAFHELAARAAATVMEAQANQEAPIEKVIEKSQISRDRSLRTLFGIIFNFVNVPKVYSGGGAVDFAFHEFETGTVTYDLNVEFSQNEDGLLFAFEYNTDIFQGATIQAFSEHFRFVLEQVLANPQNALSDFNMLTGQQETQLREWSGSVSPYPRDLAAHALFEKQAARTPAATALVFGNQAMTYAELNRRANQIARLLAARGLRPGELAGLCLPKSMEMIAAVLGVLKASGAYLPLDPAYPAEHLRTILGDARPALVIADASTRAVLPVDERDLILLDALSEEIASQPDDNLNLPVKPDDLVYCIYTSGSTGHPKGVLVEHRSLVNFTNGAQRYYHIQPGDRMLQFASLNFDTSAEEIFPTLCSGAALALRSGDMLDSIPRFIERCREWELTILDLPTAFWHELVQYLEKSHEKLPEKIRLIIIGGERVSPAHLSTWHSLGMESVHLDNTYGLTECTCVAARCRLTAQERREYSQREAPIGKAIDNVRLYVLDENRRRLPPGVAGELYIGGECLARGYLNLPELTDERFLPDPFAQAAGARMYKTGDLVQWRRDGSLEYLGRSDEQIKIRGFRIEPGEIESALMQFKGIQDAVVIKREDPAGTEQLLAYLVMEGDARLPEKELRGYLNSKLPKYMQPAYYTALNEFPVSPNHKIDKRALPDPDWARARGGEERKGPETPAEEKMLAIWEQALGRQGIGVEDNFFDIGGHSLLAARMMTEVESAFGVTVPLVTLLEKPTIRELTRTISATGWKPAWKSLVSLKANGSRAPLFLVHAVGGDVLSYRRLAQHLADLTRPIHGLRAQGLDGTTPPLENIEDMAAFYIKEIREIQPQGPYFLGGYSFGGTVAYEMAQQLAAAGEKTDLLAMFDTVVMNNLPENLRPGRWLLAYDGLLRLVFVMRKWLGLSLPKKADYGRKALRVAGDRLKALIHREKYLNPVEQGDQERWLRKPPAFQNVEKANRRALAAYITKPCTSVVTYFKARQREWSEMVRPEPLWRKLALGGLRVFNCEGNHNSIIIEPYVKSLADALREVLCEIEDSQA